MIHNVRGFVMLRINAINRQKRALLGLFPRPQKMLLSIALRADNKKTKEYVCIKYPPNSTLYSYRKGFQALS
jgi:hypothetical protein